MKNLYFCFLIFFILEGCVCWIATDMGTPFYTIISFLTIISWMSGYKKREKIPFSYIVMFIGLCIVHIISSRGRILGFFSYAANVFAISTPLFLRVSDQKILLSRINRFFYIIVTISIVFHLLMICGLLPSAHLFKRGMYMYQNYYIYLYSPDYESRFCGFCYEPGFFSLLLSALLLINNYDIKKKWTIVFLVALFLTFSLGGYILTATSWLLYYILQRRKQIRHHKRNFLIISLMIYGGFFIVGQWNRGENMMNEKIFSRLEYDAEKGISGNNRQNLDAEVEWIRFLNSDSILFGYGDKKYSEMRSNNYDASSILEFVMCCGIIGTILHIIMIGFFAFKAHKIIYALPGFLFLLLDFIQHGYDLQVSMFLLIFLWVVHSHHDETRDVLFSRT